MTMTMKDESKLLLKIIAEELQNTGGKNTEVVLYDAELLDNGWNRYNLERAFNKLKSEGVIEHKEVKYAPNSPQPTNPIHASFTASRTLVYDRLAYVLKVNKSKVKSSDSFSVAQVRYNPTNGFGFVNSKKFRFKDDQPEFIVFQELYNDIGASLSRARILKLSKYPQDEDDIGGEFTKKTDRESAAHRSETYFINELAKKIRGMTGLNTNQLTLNNGSLTLIGTKLEGSPN